MLLCSSNLNSYYRAFQTDIARFVSLAAFDLRSKPAQQTFLDDTLVRFVNALDPVLKLTFARWQ
jgi:hypothetical protein